MNAEQQKGDQHHGDGGAGGTRFAEHGPQQAFTAFDQQRALTVNLMEQVCDPKNLLRAYRRVRSNKGTPGVDGMTRSRSGRLASGKQHGVDGFIEGRDLSAPSRAWSADSE